MAATAVAAAVATVRLFFFSPAPFLSLFRYRFFLSLLDLDLLGTHSCGLLSLSLTIFWGFYVHCCNFFYLSCWDFLLCVNYGEKS